MHYTLKDHQGNLMATVCGNDVERLSYDAWGRRRNTTDFGYGNVSHTFNRYAYCSHNPLRFTDPTGWYQQPGTYGINPNYNPGGHTTYHSDDPNDILRGRSLHPCEAGNPIILHSTRTKYMQGNNNEGETGNNKFYTAKGKYLGTDGKNEGKIFVVYNVKSDLDGTQDVLSYIDNQDVISFIKENNGNANAFSEGCIAYLYSFELPTLENRIMMIKNVSTDTGKDKDALNPSNNREYGGVIGGDEVYQSEVKSPKDSGEIRITLPGDCDTYHSHPSGFVYEEFGGNVGGYSKKYYFQQIPLSFDLSHCGNHNCFVIGRGSGYVYGYNSSGTHIKIKTSLFNDPNYFKP